MCIRDSLMASFNSLTAFEVEPLSNNDNLPGNNSKASPVSMLVVYVSFQLNTNENKNTTCLLYTSPVNNIQQQ